VPHAPLRTSQARGALPPEVPMADAVFNTAHAALLALGLAGGNWELVGRGLADRLHQDRRAHLYPRSMEVVRRAPGLGALGATISGAGPTVLVWCHYEQTGGVVEALRREAAGWADVLRVPFESQGARVREIAPAG
jgi:homoserine kinase